MIQLLLIPGASVGSISIGMSRESVYETTGEPDSTFLKSRSSMNPVEVYNLFGLHVYYSSNGYVEFIECFKTNETQLMLGGTTSVFDTDANSLISTFTEALTLIEEEPGSCYISKVHGISLWRSTDEERYFQAIGIANGAYFA